MISGALQAQEAERHQLAVVGNPHRRFEHPHQRGRVGRGFAQLQGRNGTALVQRLQRTGVRHDPGVSKAAIRL
jgi:hypothetical protein